MGTWQHKEFEKCLTKVTYTNKIQQFDFKESGKYPIISQNAEFISGYWDNDKDVFKLSKPVVIFGDHTRCLKYIDFDFVLGADGVKILQTIDEILPKYLYYYLQYIPIDNLGYSRHYKLLKEKIIKYPTIEQQQQIVEILDKADEIRAKKKLANDKLDEFLKSTFISMFGDPVRNEKNLPIKEIVDISTLVSSGSTPLGGSSVYQTEGVLFIRSQNVLMNKFDFSDIAYISDEIYDSMTRTQVKKNDVLLNITGASIGRIHSYMFDDKANVNQHVCIIRPILDETLPVYLEFCIGNSNYQYEILRKNAGATRQAFNYDQIKKFKIPLPKIEEQNKFAKIVEKVEAQKQKNEFVIEQMNNLFNSLSQRAFKGGL